MTPQELETAIRKGRPPVLSYIYGEESFLVERATNRLLEAALDPSLRDFNFNMFYGNEAKGVDIVDASQTLPMFADRRVVLVKRADHLESNALDDLLDYARNPCETTCLIFNAVKVDQRRKFFQELKKRGALLEYRRLYDNKLSGFILSEAQTYGKSMDPVAADLLSIFVGNNLRELSSQLEKLSIYVGSRSKITMDDVRDAASDSKVFTVFELARYLGTKDLKNAFKSLDTLFLNGEEIPMMIGALARHFRQLWRVREMLDRNAPLSDISKEVGVNTYFLGEYAQQAKNFKRGELRDIFEELRQCDLASKSGGKPYILMSNLILGICSHG